MKYSIYLDDLVQELSPRDHAVLSNLKANEDSARAIDNELYRQAFLNLCTSSVEMDAVTYAQKYEQIAAESNGRFVGRVQKALRTLSSDGRQLPAGPCLRSSNTTMRTSANVAGRKNGRPTGPF